MLNLRAQNISKSYTPSDGRSAAVQALERVSLEYSSSEILCIVGPNGSGKSTLLRILSGIEVPDSGHVISEKNDREKIPRVGLLLQDLGLFDWKTVREHIDFGLLCGGTDRKLWDVQAEKILAKLSLVDHADKYPSELSGGLKQRCAIARLLAYGAEMLLLDEPFSAIDPEGRMDLNAMLEGLWDKGTRGLVVVTHDLEGAVLLADRIIAVRGSPGHIVGEVTIGLERPRRLSDRYSGQFRDALKSVEKLLELTKDI